MAGQSIFVLGSFVVSCSAKVSRFPLPGESLAATSVTIEAGGKGFNLAVMARRLGMEVTGLLATGDDLAAQFAGPALARADLPQSMLVRLSGPTGAGIGFTDAQGETSLAVAGGANLALSAADVRSRANAIRGAAIVLAQFEASAPAVEESFALARRAGVPTLLNPSPFRELTPKLMRDTSMLIINETEARELARMINADPSAVDFPDRFLSELSPAVRALGPEGIILTRGPAGAIASFRDATFVQPGFSVDVVDTLGAGDAFAGTLAVRLAQQVSFDQAMRDAAAAGALTTRHHGVFDALPSTDEIKKMTARGV